MTAYNQTLALPVPSIHPYPKAFVAIALGDYGLVKTGYGRIASVVYSQIGSTKVALAFAKVFLNRADTGALLAITTADASGAYEFKGLPKGVLYRVTAQDPDKTIESASTDWIYPE